MTTDSNCPDVSQEDLDRIDRVFNILDADNDRKLSAMELVRQGSMALGFSPTLEEAKDMLKDINPSEEGTITYDQFKASMIKKLKHLDYEQSLLRDAFKKFDKNGDGFVTTAEMRTVLCRAGQETMTTEEVDEWFKEFDGDQDGKLNYEEFVAMFTQEMM